MEMMQKLMQQYIEKMDINLPEAERKKIIQMMIEIFDKGKSPREAIGFSTDMIEYMYNYGYRLYNMGNYQNAKEVFASLISFMPSEGRFFLALGASHHRLKEYNKAVDYYLVYGGLEPNNPIPYYYMYDCYYHSGFVDDALICLMEVIRRCGEDPIYAKLKERSQLMLDNLKIEIAELEQKGELIVDQEEVPKESNEIKISDKSISKVQKKVVESVLEEIKKEEHAEVKKL